MAELRVAIIGTGSVAHLHAEACLATPGVRLKAVVEVVPERARAFADRYRVPDVYADYRDVLKDPSIDAVIVCLPNYLHAPVAVAALEAGKHVLVEKPLATSAAEAAQVVAAQQATGRTLMVGLNNRFRPEVLLARQYAEAECGEVYYGRCGWFRRRGIPGWGSWFTQKAKAGGGPLLDIGVHMLDMCLFLMGYPEPVAATGATYAKFGPERRGLGGWGIPELEGGVFDVEDLAVGQIRFANGATVQLEVSWALHTQDSNWVEVMGTRGGVAIAGNKVQVYSERFGQPVDMAAAPSGERDRVALLKHFVQCCATGEEPLTSGRHGLILNRIFDAIYASAARGGEQVAV